MCYLGKHAEMVELKRSTDITVIASGQRVRLLGGGRSGQGEINVASGLVALAESFILVHSRFIIIC